MYKAWETKTLSLAHAPRLERLHFTTNFAFLYHFVTPELMQKFMH